MRRTLLVALLFWTALAGAASAHGTRVFLSTPVSPPAEFEWVPLAALVLLAGANAWLARRVGCAGWLGSVLGAGLAVGLGGLAFYWFGCWAAHTSTAPPSGLGWGAAVHWGYGWSEVGSEFATWNVIGFMFLGSALTVLCVALGVHGWRRSLGIIGANLGLYLMCLTPYIWTGALSHGWPGTYTHMDCRGRLAGLGMELLTYARKHGRLPAESEVQEMLAQPHSWGRERGLCPVGLAAERKPRRYTWNPAMSGMPWAEVEKLQRPEVLLSCPYHPLHEEWYPSYHALYTADILKPQMDSGREYVTLETCKEVHGEALLPKTPESPAQR